MERNAIERSSTLSGFLETVRRELPEQEGSKTTETYTQVSKIAFGKIVSLLDFAIGLKTK